MAIISVQSQLVAGHVGNSAAVFALQRLGHEVWALPTILLSHHPGHGGSQGQRIPVDLTNKLLTGMDSRHCFSQCDAMISGYLGGPEDEGTVRTIIERSRRSGQNFTYLCDPVLGDDGRKYVADDVEQAIKNLAALADILTPNAFELALLTQSSFATRNGALAALRSAQTLGPAIILLTSFRGHDTLENEIDVMIVDRERSWRLAVPRFDYKFCGAGDLLSAFFLHYWLRDHDSAFAINAACSALHEILAETVAQSADELCIIAAQDRFASAVGRFDVERLS